MTRLDRAARYLAAVAVLEAEFRDVAVRRRHPHPLAKRLREHLTLAYPPDVAGRLVIAFRRETPEAALSGGGYYAEVFVLDGLAGVAGVLLHRVLGASVVQQKRGRHGATWWTIGAAALLSGRSRLTTPARRLSVTLPRRYVTRWDVSPVAPGAAIRLLPP